MLNLYKTSISLNVAADRSNVGRIRVIIVIMLNNKVLKNILFSNIYIFEKLSLQALTFCTIIYSNKRKKYEELHLKKILIFFLSTF